MEHSRIKILVLASWYPNRVQPLYALFVKRHVEELQKTCEVAVLTVVPDPSISKKRYEIEKSREDGVLVFRAYCRKVREHRFLYGLCFWKHYLRAALPGLREVAREFGRPDLVHVQVAVPIGALALTLRFLIGIPYVVTEHFSGYTDESGVFSNWNPANRRLAKWVFQRAEHVVAVSGYLLRALRGHQLLPGKASVLPNVVHIPEKPGQQDSGGPLRVLTVCNLVDRIKDVSGLIRAFERICCNVHEAELHIVGDGPDRDALENLAGRQVLAARRIWFHGQVSPKKLGRYYEQASLFVLNSRFETFSVVTAEAMAHGLPVVVTRCGGPEEFVDDSCGILVDPGDEEGLARAMEAVLCDPSRFDRREIHHRAARLFDRKELQGAYLRVFRECVRSFRVGYCGERISVEPGWRVVDVGSGHNPHPRADVLLERELGGTIHRSGRPAASPAGRKVVLGDAAAMPFGNHAFDFSIATHVVEHVENPRTVLEELERVSRRGYIEVPGALSDLLLAEPYHLWSISRTRDVLHIRRSRRTAPLLESFYALFYLNEERPGHRTIRSNGRLARLLKRFLNAVWRRIPGGYTRYHWEGHIRFQFRD